MSTREALAALIHHVLLPCALQVGLGLPIGEAAVEEVWAWPAHYQFYCVGKDTIQSQGKAGSWNAKKLPVSAFCLGGPARSRCHQESSQGLSETGTGRLQPERSRKIILVLNVVEYRESFRTRLDTRLGYKSSSASFASEVNDVLRVPVFSRVTTRVQGR